MVQFRIFVQTMKFRIDESLKEYQNFVISALLTIARTPNISSITVTNIFITLRPISYYFPFPASKYLIYRTSYILDFLYTFSIPVTKFSIRTLPKGLQPIHCVNK